MTPQERVMTMLDGRLPDRVPLLHGFWGEWVEMWRRDKGLPPDADPDAYYGVDTYIAAGDETPYVTRAHELKREGDFIYSLDGWGQTKRTRASVSYFYEQLAFAYDEAGKLVYGDFDPVDLPQRYEWLDGQMAALKRRYCVFAKTGGPFIRTYFMRGEVPFLMDMAADPAKAREMALRTAHHLTAIGLEELRRWDLYDTGIWIYDDMAAAKGPMFSPQAAADILAPAWSYMVSAY